MDAHGVFSSPVAEPSHGTAALGEHSAVIVGDVEHFKAIDRAHLRSGGRCDKLRAWRMS